jgi:poly(A) polymerase
MNKALDKKVFKIIRQSFQEIENFQEIVNHGYVIGVYVRDYIIGRIKETKSIDIFTIGDVILLAKLVSKKIEVSTRIRISRRFVTAFLKYDNKEIKFLGRKSALEEDQKRRDFPINSLAINDSGQFMDPFNGFQDLKDKIIRTPDITDPLRMIRALRLGTKLKFRIEKSSFYSIQKNVNSVTIDSIMEELHKILLSDQPSQGIRFLYGAGLLSIFLTEVTDLQGIEEKDGYRHKDNFFHTIEVVDNVSRKSSSLWLRWAALLHDIGKNITKKYLPKIGWSFHSHEFVGSNMIPKIFKRFKQMRYVKKIVRYSSRPVSLVNDQTTDSAIRRFIFDAGKELEDLMLLCKSDITTKNVMKKRQYKDNLTLVYLKLQELEEKDRLRNWKSPLSGNDIMNLFKIQPCKQVGLIKKSLKAAILEGEIANEFDAAYKFILRR